MIERIKNENAVDTEYSLSKASYLAKKLHEEIDVTAENSVDAMIFDDYEAELVRVTYNLEADLTDQKIKIVHLYHLRNIIKQANKEHIDDLLCDLAALQMQLKIFSSVRLSPVPRKEVVASLLAKAAKMDEDSWRRPNTEFSSQESHDFIDSTVKDIKKSIVRIEEEISELNLTTKVVVPSYVMDTLQKLDLV